MWVTDPLPPACLEPCPSPTPPTPPLGTPGPDRTTTTSGALQEAASEAEPKGEMTTGAGPGVAARVGAL